MKDVIENIYQPGMSAQKLANILINLYFDGKEPSFPINPFKMMRDLGIVYQFMEFKDLEGICTIAARTPDEQYADQFASELLMPTEYLRQFAQKYIINGHVSVEDALEISEHFGASC